MSSICRAAAPTRSRRPQRIPVHWGPPIALPPLKQNEVGPAGRDVSEVRAGWELGRGIDEDRKIVAMSDRGELVERWPGGFGQPVDDPGGLGSEGGLVLPGLGLAHPAARDDLVEPDFDESRSGGSNAVVVGAALVASDDELVWEAPGIGEALDLGEILSGQDGGGAQGQRGRRAAGDDGSLGARDRGQAPPGRGLADPPPGPSSRPRPSQAWRTGAGMGAPPSRVTGPAALMTVRTSSSS